MKRKLQQFLLSEKNLKNKVFLGNYMRIFFVYKVACIKFTFSNSFKTISKLIQKVRIHFWFFERGHVESINVVFCSYIRATTRPTFLRTKKRPLRQRGVRMTHRAAPGTATILAFVDLHFTSFTSRSLGLWWYDF